MQTIPTGASLAIAAAPPAPPAEGVEPTPAPTVPPAPDAVERAPTRASWRLLALAVAVAAALGAAQGVRAVVGGDDEAEAEAPPPGSLTRDWRRGTLWLPAGSEARRPQAPARPLVWRPLEAGAASTLADH